MPRADDVRECPAWERPLAAVRTYAQAAHAGHDSPSSFGPPASAFANPQSEIHNPSNPEVRYGVSR